MTRRIKYNFELFEGVKRLQVGRFSECIDDAEARFLATIWRRLAGTGDIGAWTFCSTAEFIRLKEETASMTNVRVSKEDLRGRLLRSIGLGTVGGALQGIHPDQLEDILVIMWPLSPLLVAGECEAHHIASDGLGWLTDTSTPPASFVAESPLLAVTFFHGDSLSFYGNSLSQEHAVKVVEAVGIEQGIAATRSLDPM